jgi:signal transduction histidine kinase
VLVIGGVVWVVQAYDQRRTARQLEELERRHAVERERARIACDIHDDVGAGLTEVAMLSELAQDDAVHPGELRGHLDGIFRRVRSLTQSLDEIVWAINPANDTLESFLSYLGEFAQDFLAAAGVACRLDLPADPPACPLSATMRHHLYLAVKELLHNTVKHAAASEVQLSVRLVGQELRVSLRDNGRGFEPAVVASVASGRNGLTNLRTRLGEVGGRFQQESAPGQGTHTVLSVELPTAPAAPEVAK